MHGSSEEKKKKVPSKTPNMKRFAQYLASVDNSLLVYKENFLIHNLFFRNLSHSKSPKSFEGALYRLFSALMKLAFSQYIILMYT